VLTLESRRGHRGYNIGTRLVDEYFAKTGGARCLDFREAAEAVAKGGLRLFLGVNATCQNWAPDGLACSIVLDDNPLADFVELPEQYRRARQPSSSAAG
jgi:hypothetical protein